MVIFMLSLLLCVKHAFNSFGGKILFLVRSESSDQRAVVCVCGFLHLGIILHVNTNLCLAV